MMCGPALWGLGRLRDVYPIYIVRSYTKSYRVKTRAHAGCGVLRSTPRTRRTTSTGDTGDTGVRGTGLMVTRSLKRRKSQRTTASMRVRAHATIRADPRQPNMTSRSYTRVS